MYHSFAGIFPLLSMFRFAIPVFVFQRVLWCVFGPEGGTAEFPEDRLEDWDATANYAETWFEE
jgi:hypothetical protein